MSERNDLKIHYVSYVSIKKIMNQTTKTRFYPNHSTMKCKGEPTPYGCSCLQLELFRFFRGQIKFKDINCFKPVDLCKIENQYNVGITLLDMKSKKVIRDTSNHFMYKATLCYLKGHYLQMPENGYTLGPKSKYETKLFNGYNLRAEVHTFNFNHGLSYDGTSYAEHDFSENKYMFNRDPETMYVRKTCIKVKDIKCMHDPKKALKQAWTRYSEDSDAIRKALKSLQCKQPAQFVHEAILTNGKLPVVAKHLFAKYTPFLKGKLEDISQHEATWLRSTNFGALIWCQKGAHVSHGYEYDINKMYTFLLTKYKPMKCPSGPGKTTFMTTASLGMPYGLYQCSIVGVHPMIKRNPAGYYTHFDIDTALSKGLEVHMSSESPNAYIYPDDKLIPCKVMFKKYFKDLLYVLNTVPQATKPRVKQLMNCLWGSLCERNIVYDVKFNAENKLDLDEYEIINAKDDIFDIISLKQYYKTKYARLGPFLIAAGRKYLNEELHDVDPVHIKRVHTDGFISDIPLDLNISKDVGAWKLAKEGQVFIKNVNFPMWQ